MIQLEIKFKDPKRSLDKTETVEINDISELEDKVISTLNVGIISDKGAFDKDGLSIDMVGDGYEFSIYECIDETNIVTGRVDIL